MGNSNQTEFLKMFIVIIIVIIEPSKYSGLNPQKPRPNDVTTTHPWMMEVETMAFFQLYNNVNTGKVGMKIPFRVECKLGMLLVRVLNVDFSRFKI